VSESSKPTGAPDLSPLEFRLERLKRLGNLELDYLKRLYDGRPLGELYRRGEMELHVHFAMNGMYCATYRRLDGVKVRSVDAGIAVGGKTAPDTGEAFVFVAIGQVAQSFSPIASRIRLQPLNRCDMGRIDAFEPSTLFPPREALFRVFNRKLREVLTDAGIEFGEFKNEVIQGGSEVIDNLPDQNSNVCLDEGFIRTAKNDLVRGIRIELNDNGILLAAQDIGKPLPKISKVFVCPRYSCACAIEGMN
jgi:hypothetical protein